MIDYSDCLPLDGHISRSKLTDEVRGRGEPGILSLFSSLLSFLFFFFWSFLGLHLRHMQVPRIGVESELQLPAMQDPSHVCNVYHSSQQCQILNSWSEARDRTFNLMVPSQICFCCATKRIPLFHFFNWVSCLCY